MQATCEVRSCTGTGLARFEGVQPCDGVLSFAHEPTPSGGWHHVGTCRGCIGGGKYLDLETAVNLPAHQGPVHSQALETVDRLEKLLGFLDLPPSEFDGRINTLANVFGVSISAMRQCVESWYQATWRREHPHDPRCIHGMTVCVECDPYLNSQRGNRP